MVTSGFGALEPEAKTIDGAPSAAAGNGLGGRASRLPERSGRSAEQAEHRMQGRAYRTRCCWCQHADYPGCGDLRTVFPLHGEAFFDESRPSRPLWSGQWPQARYGLSPMCLLGAWCRSFVETKRRVLSDSDLQANKSCIAREVCDRCCVWKKIGRGSFRLRQARCGLTIHFEEPGKTKMGSRRWAEPQGTGSMSGTINVFHEIIPI